ncbi:uncharacterized protein FIBRA_04354 [Fibroporia radiculosa]|uniref:Uncharacterized protein n=1 Tax=Fibroporia radiculosa TaxID=599839 RepID=J4H2X2_9APHY|nr:uncharacterized protein FIBRA_04354 [Fibroporia radiculosa]CCM02269.1 predicted protein [Fibroporia radiculosa]
MLGKEYLTRRPAFLFLKLTHPERRRRRLPSVVLMLMVSSPESTTSFFGGIASRVDVQDRKVNTGTSMFIWRTTLESDSRWADEQTSRVAVVPVLDAVPLTYMITLHSTQL